MAKRLVEVVLAALAAVVAAPLVALAALGIRLSSAGPVLYRAERVGRDRRPFIMFKLRTMNLRRRSDSSRITGARDPRVMRLESERRRRDILRKNRRAHHRTPVT